MCNKFDIRNKVVFIDLEVTNKNKIVDIGAVDNKGKEFHSNTVADFAEFIKNHSFVCGHNIFRHDLKYIGDEIGGSSIEYFIDTLYWSPLLFPKIPYHKLVKDDKLCSDELNNPLNDSKKAQILLDDEVAEFCKLHEKLKKIYYSLLKDKQEFKDFFTYVGYKCEEINIAALIGEFFKGKICENAPIQKIVNKYPIELCYAISQLTVIITSSITPAWVLNTYPRVENILHALRNQKCLQGCKYCNECLDEIKGLKKYFNYDGFRSYDGVNLQQQAVQKAIAEKSLLAIFPTGGGKSITFQLPALMAGENEKGLTVVISPLQSLMKDQVDNLEQEYNITNAVTINGALNVIERGKAFERVRDGSANILYISPESLRSKSIELLLQSRNIVRFVIDEAHCFSSWGQDFRSDYLYIADFIKELQEKKRMPTNIPISCFTATAKEKVIDDIRDYFKSKLDVDLEVLRAKSSRDNLSYHVIEVADDKEKMSMIRKLIGVDDEPSIIYVSARKKAEELAYLLQEVGYRALYYHGQMDRQLRIENQEAFMCGDANIMVATTAFGMGVDKKNVKKVIHYDISDSLENYVQEAGRAGRDQKINADCYILYNDDSLNKHFIMLNQTKVSIKEIKQIWKALKKFTTARSNITKSALEIAREAGWDDRIFDIETRVRTAISALEQSGFIKRGQNMPRIFADSILVKNMEEARQKIVNSPRFDDQSRQNSIRIISKLISSKSKTRGDKEMGESRIDYISDELGLSKEDVVRSITLMREEKILADAKDLVAYIKNRETANSAIQKVNIYISIEKFLFDYFEDEEKTYNIKEINELLQETLPNSNINQLKELLNYFDIKRLIKRHQTENKNYVTIKPYQSMKELRKKSERRHDIAQFVIKHLYSKVQGGIIEFSVLELKDEYNYNIFNKNADIDEIEDSLYYLLKIGVLKVEGGFLVTYNAMNIQRLATDNAIHYKKEHYTKLEEYYKSRLQQIHIVGEYARKMIDDYDKALKFVDDYFTLNYDIFLNKYFRGRRDEISKNMTNKQFVKLFGELSLSQLSIVADSDSKCIVVGAGPGSGKTKLLTHKLASLYQLEDVKHEQMLMLTFSRSSATEFKKRLMGLLGNAANYIQITTFHSYCFDLLGKVGNVENSNNIVKKTIEKIKSGEVDLNRLTKTVLVIDEAQDMCQDEFELVKLLMEINEDIRVIAVGDDDQNIYEFRGSSSTYFQSLLNIDNAKKYELVDNYRAQSNLVAFSNMFAESIKNRFKDFPIYPTMKELGEIEITNLSTDNVIIPVVNNLLTKNIKGSTCIAVKTNKEAVNLVGLLTEKGIEGKLIQSNKDFNLFNLVEFRYFFALINAENDAFSIPIDLWENSKRKLQNEFVSSSDLPGVMNMISDFEKVNNKIKYKSDFKLFITESKLEDLTISNKASIYVSTIHKTKGREFDNVFLGLSSYVELKEETKRAIYVAITRAKQNLYIACNGNYFNNITVENMLKIKDGTNYGNPRTLIIQLSHEDVALDAFLYYQKVIECIYSGQVLSVKDNACYIKDKKVITFSSKFKQELTDLVKSGYLPTKAIVRHIVYWYGEKIDREIKILLADVEFKAIYKE